MSPSSGRLNRLATAFAAATIALALAACGPDPPPVTVDSGSPTDTGVEADGEDQPDGMSGCSPTGKVEERSCGSDDMGTQTRNCQSSGDWSEWGDCITPGDCESGQTQMEACGLNDNGSRTRTCQSDGSWGDWQMCNDPDVCTNGETESKACPDSDGMQTRTCESGQWGAWEGCSSGGDWIDVSPGAHQPRDAENTCAVRSDGSVRCWKNDGKSGNVQTYPGPFADVVAAADYPGMCGIEEDDTIKCQNVSATLDNPPTAGFTQIDMTTTSDGSEDFACGIRMNGQLECWGDGSNSKTNPPGGSFTSLSTGNGFACAVANNGALECWGETEFLPQAISGGYKMVDAGTGIVCAIDQTDALSCWTEAETEKFEEGTGLSGITYTGIAVSWDHVCGLKSDGTAVCWGANHLGQANPPAGQFDSIHAAGPSTCGLKKDGTIACWGGNGCVTSSSSLSGINTSNQCGGCGPTFNSGNCRCGGSFSCRPEHAFGYGACADGDNTIGKATSLPKTDDGQNWLEKNDQLDGRDEDWFSVEVTDNTLSNLNPQIEVSSSSFGSVEACMFYEPTAGELSPGDVDCPESATPYGYSEVASVESGQIQGCCALLTHQSNGDYKGATSVNWGTVNWGDDSGTAYISVASQGGTPICGAYKLRYKF